MALRPGFVRYAVRFQYHGGPFLGFSQQREEDCVTWDGTDLRGYTSVETRLRRALDKLVPSVEEPFELRVSSRTDRGVHALGNTLHVDFPSGILSPAKLLLGWQYHLTRDDLYHRSQSSDMRHTKRIKNASLYPHGDDYVRAGPGRDIYLLNAVEAPLTVRYTRNDEEVDEDWNARFSATERLYVYRILQQSYVADGPEYQKLHCGAPFEWDRSWILKPGQPLNLLSMQLAADALVGTHDFSSFRAKGCQQSSPVVQIRDIAVEAQPYGFPQQLSNTVGWESAKGIGHNHRLITISVRANAFLYRMVRNIVGYLVHVGQQGMGCDSNSRKKMIQQSTQELLAARDRTLAPSMAPAHGLFLVHVQHGDFNF